MRVEMRGDDGTIRRALWRQLEPSARQGPGLSPLNAALCAFILAVVLLSILETEPQLIGAYRDAFDLAELSFGFVFLLEYVARFWIASESSAAPAWQSRARFALSFAGVVDLIVVVASLMPSVGSGLAVLRVLRLLRILRLAKLGRLSRAFEHVLQAVSSRRYELLVSFTAGLSLMVIAATMLYLTEGSAQPEKFGSIPRALWWAVATFTTIGYGDVYPITALGKLFAAVTALVSIGFVAMPTAILAAAFSDAMQRHRDAGERSS